MARVRDALAAAGIDEGSYCGHSLSWRQGESRVGGRALCTSSTFVFLGNNLRDTPACWGRRDRTCVGYCLSNYVNDWVYLLFFGFMWGEGPYGPSLGRAGGRPPSTPPPSLTPKGAGLTCPCTTAKYYTRQGGLLGSGWCTNTAPVSS